MTQCAKIVGFMANVGIVFIKRLQTSFYLFSTFYVFNVFLNFYLNVYYIYGWKDQGFWKSFL